MYYFTDKDATIIELSSESSSQVGYSYVKGSRKSNQCRYVIWISIFTSMIIIFLWVRSRSIQVDNFHQKYHSSSDINKYVKSLNVDWEVLGMTQENNEILLVKFISNENNPSMFLNCGSHARELIPSAMCLYFLDRFARPDSNLKTILQQINVLMIPLHNPDGRDYALTVDARWRKTRSIVKGTDCRGIDLSRNWPLGDADVSNNPCEENFGGRERMDAVEIQYLWNAIQKVKNLGVFIDFHSKGQMIAYPFGHRREKVKDSPFLQKLGEELSREIALVHGKTYTVAHVPSILYDVGGSAIDYIYEKLKPRCTFVVELRPKKAKGWVLDEAEIIPQGEEMIPFVTILANKLIDGSCFKLEN